ncbi:MAG TPA: acetate--CoA ligase family protein, partial [Streptosporangiaceae bacterium]
TAVAEEVRRQEAPTDELPVIEDVTPARPAVVSREEPTVQVPVVPVVPVVTAATPPPDPASLVSPERLAEFFAPRSIALVGASDHSAWARFVLASTAAAGFDGDLIPVHHVRRTVFGRPAVGSLRDLTEPPDLAFILAPADAVESVLDDAGAAGVRGAIVLASGYRETGAQGEAMERALAAKAAAHGITLLGPNCLGFVNAHAKAGPFALTAPRPLQAGPVGIALQSGALASVMLNFARARAIGISTLATMGNEAMITAPDMIDYLVADEHTTVICLFLEQIGDPARFAAAAERARAAGKPIVALKAGSSAVGRQAALAHTGSVAGDDAVVDAALRQMNIIRVTSIEELLTTAALLGYGRVPAGRRMAVLSASGGACDIIADRAAAHGIELPPFSAKAAEAIEPHLPPFAQVRNPLDVTGYFLANQRYSALTAIDHALDAAVQDPELDVVFFTGLTLPDVRPADDAAASLLEERVAWLGRRIASAPIPVITVGSTCTDITEYGRGLLGPHDIHLTGGIDLGLQAIGNVLRWAEGRDRRWAGPAVPPAGRFAALRGPDHTEKHREAELQAAEPPAGDAEAAEMTADGVWPEADARALLTSFAIPVVPAELTGSPDAAAAAARAAGYPVALRISSAALPHKSEAGGVALNLRTVTQVRSAFKRVSAAGGLPPELIDGVTVSPMRTGGTELLAGVTVDPAFGPVLAVGLGGVWVEILGDVSLRVLPVTPDDVRMMLGELRAAPLLTGARGSEPADLDALARVICAIGDAALSLGGSLRALEVNPLWVSGTRIEALDVLIETGPDGKAPPDSPGPPHRTDPGE